MYCAELGRIRRKLLANHVLARRRLDMAVYFVADYTAVLADDFEISVRSAVRVGFQLQADVVA